MLQVMNNGRNDWGVAFSKIVWFERLLRNHKNVADVNRHSDICFSLRRVAQIDELSVLGCDEYTMGLAAVFKALDEFGRLDIIHVGVGWCGYTKEAKLWCIENKIGLYVSDEMSGALWKDEFWAYHKKDEKGDPVYYFHLS
jgi:hypothetical protein